MPQKIVTFITQTNVINTATSAYYAVDIYQLSSVSMILKIMPINEKSE